MEKFSIFEICWRNAFLIRPCQGASQLPTGLAFLDETTGGGLPKSALTELISPSWSGGSASVIAALLGAAYRDGYFVALIDGWDSFDPQGFPAAPLRHLLWARCRKTSEAMKAADLLLRDGNFPLVIIDLVLNPKQEIRKIAATSWYRLQRLAEESPTACLILTRQSMVESAQLKIVLEHSWTLTNLEDESARSVTASASGATIPSFRIRQLSPICLFLIQSHVRHHLSSQFLFTGRSPISTGIVNKTRRLNRRKGKETGHYSTERSSRIRRGPKRNDSQSGPGPLFAGVNQSAEPGTGKIDPGNAASLCFYLESFCGSDCSQHFDCAIHRSPKSFRKSSAGHSTPGRF